MDPIGELLVWAFTGPSSCWMKELLDCKGLFCRAQDLLPGLRNKPFYIKACDFVRYETKQIWHAPAKAGGTAV
jgi:hypothetical protein